MAKAKKVTNQGSDRLATMMQGELMQKLNANWKKPLIGKASEHKFQVAPRIPTGIFNLDYCLRGGLPVGRVTLSWGNKGSFKTSLFLRAIANAQKMCANCWIPMDPVTGEIVCTCDDYREPIIAYANVESAWDKEWTGLMGVDPERLLYSEPEYGEQCVDICEALLRSGDTDIVCLDSIAFMIPMKEIEESAEKALMGEHPRLVGRAIRKFNAAIDYCGNTFGRRPTLFLVNQVRQKMTMFGDPTTQPGGQAPGFVSSVELKLSAGKYTIDDKTGQPKYVDMTFRLEKSKVSPSHSEGEFRLILQNTECKNKGDVQDEPQLMDLAEQVGVITSVNKNKWIAGNVEFRARSQIERRLMTDREFSYVIRSITMDKLVELDKKINLPTAPAPEPKEEQAVG